MPAPRTLVIGLGLSLAACAAEPPPPAEPRPPAPAASGASAYAPFPYTADQIRDATRPGRTYMWRVEKDGEPAVLRTVRFVRADAVGFATEVVVADEKGKELSRKAAPDGTWEDLHRHAAFPRGQTKVSEVEITVPEGKHACLLYVVDDGKGGVDTYYFAKSRPGAPVLFVHEEKGKRVMTSTLIAYSDGP